MIIKRGSFLRSVAILSGGTAIGQVVTLAATPILTRLYTPQEFGLLALYTAVIATFMAIGSLRFEQAIGLPVSDKTAVGILVIAIWSGLVSAIVASLSTLFIPAVLVQIEKNELPSVLLSLLVFLGVFLSIAYQALGMWALRRKAFIPIAQTKISQGIGATAGQIILGTFGFGSVGLLTGHALGQSLGSSNLIRLTLKEEGFKHPNLREVRRIFLRYKRFPLLATPAALLNTASLQVIVFVLTAMVSPAAAGQYMLSSRITIGPLGLIGNAIGNVFYSEATAIGRSDRSKLRDLVLRTSRRSFLIGLLPSLLTFILSPILFEYIFGADWREAGYFSQALSVMLLASFAANPISQIFLILEKQSLSLLINIAKFIIIIVGTLVPVALSCDTTEIIWSYSLSMTLYYILVIALAFITVNTIPESKKS